MKFKLQIMLSELVGRFNTLSLQTEKRIGEFLNEMYQIGNFLSLTRNIFNG